MEGADQRQSSKRNIAGYASIASTCLLQLPGRMVLTNTISPPWPCRPLRPSRQSPARMTPTVRCSWRQREQTDQALLAPQTFASHGQRRKLPSKPSGRGRNFRPRAHAASPSIAVRFRNTLAWVRRAAAGGSVEARGTREGARRAAGGCQRSSVHGLWRTGGTPRGRVANA